MSRANRRHHRKRLKKNRRYHWGRDLLNDPKNSSKAIETPCSCSCFMCGNPRKHAKDLTMQERKVIEAEGL